MTARKCQVREGRRNCDGKPVCHGLCSKHYQRMRQRGDPKADGVGRRGGLKLTAGDVATIRQFVPRPGLALELARRFAVSEAYITMLRRGVRRAKRAAL